jgi:putative colanic acid biosynthesis acetyltransferase WcaF
MKTIHKNYNNRWYKPGSLLKRTVWYFVNVIFFKSSYFPFSKLKVIILRLFGAKVGVGVVIKPNVSIKYPWFLKIGSNSWIGEEVWIDNLANVELGENVCLSQNALLLCGNHNFKLSSFDLIIKPIILEDGVWIGAKSVVCGGVICHSHSVLTVGSVTSKSLDAYSIYKGNPAEKIKDRVIE